MSDNQLINKDRTLEVCAGDLRSVYAARDGGAVRVELCSGLAEGGMTPSIGLVRGAREVSGIAVNVLIRPRPGDFVYGEREARVMLDDIAAANEAGADGVVIGALTPEGDIDFGLVERMIKAAGKMSVTFHRAFDLCREPMEALNVLMALGVNRLLTSGQAPTALQGMELLSRLVDAAGERLSVMPGGGVNAGNAAEILDRSGAHEIHASARARIDSKMKFRRGDVSMGASGSDEYATLTTSENLVREIVRAISKS
ncbi:MAG: copper homeostasis protein CutC [Muribaculaceae bacterium]|nr:copper homeostasis protein CutC [Muribaculaceae bacterium]